MTISSILAIFDPTEAADGFADIMLGVARIFEAELTLALLAPAPVAGERAYPRHLTTQRFNELVEAKEKRLWSVAREESCEVRIVVDLVDAALSAMVRQSRCHDMLLVGPIDTFADADLYHMLLQKLLLLSGKPILLLPPAGLEGRPRRLAVGWDGMCEATRALDCALTLCASDAEIDLISVLPLTASPTLRTSAEDMCARLQARNLSARQSLARAEHKTVAAALLAHAVAGNADLIILGGFGHSPIRESVFGGVTDEVIRNRHTTPILIVH
ncbi:universal stress protein [Sphingobium yanoikuyae]|uniref:universal stress protein n=1 Tax=Sphingobium yanoikuyae TaxID=13690 RepID=UPI00241F4A43|nr:universal stress protein [Sphingobium yanoikuyae]